MKKKIILINCLVKDYLEIGSFTSLQGNLKDKKPEDLERLKNIIIKKGFDFPIFVSKIGKDNFTLDGHGRDIISALLKEDGYKFKKPSGEIGYYLPVVYVKAKNKQDAKEKLLYLNSRYGKISKEGLYEYITEKGFELDLEELKLNADIPDIDISLIDINNPEDDSKIDQIPKLPKNAIAKEGDLFLINGKHKILCGDSADKSDIHKLIGDNTLKLIFTSPPYNMSGGLYKGLSDNLTSEKYIEFNLRVVNEWKEKLYGFLFWNISYNKNSKFEHLEISYKIISELKLNFLEHVVWDKTHGLNTGSNKMFTREFESIYSYTNFELEDFKELEQVYIFNNRKKYWYNKKKGRILSNYWRAPVINYTSIEELKACFPVKLPIKAIEIFTDENELIADAFLGSGSTLIAAEKTNRICFGMEINPLYIDVILNRYHVLFPDHEIKCLSRKYNFKKLFG